MDEAILVDTDVDECAVLTLVTVPSSHVRGEVRDLFNAFEEGCGLELGPQDRAPVSQFPENVTDGRFTELWIGELLRIEALDKTGISDELGDGSLGGCDDPFDDRVCLWVDCGRIKRVVAVRDPQETGGLFEGLRADPRNFKQLLPVLEGSSSSRSLTMFSAIVAERPRRVPGAARMRY